MRTATHPIQETLRDFVFADCRLIDSAKLCASVRLKSDNVLNLIARTPINSYVPSILFLTEGWAANVVKSKSVRLVTTIKAESSALWRPGGDLPRSAVIVPILSGDAAVGVLHITSLDEGFFQERHVGQAQLLAGIFAYLLSRESLGGHTNPTSIKLGEALRRIRHTLGLTQQELSNRIGTSRIALSRWEAGGQPPRYGQLRKWCKALGILQDATRPVAEFVELSSRLVPLLRTDPELLHQLSPTQLEHLVAERLDRMGYEVVLTGATNKKDGGIDIVASPRALSVGRFLLAAQVKHHTKGRKSGPSEVRELLSWKDSHFRLGLVVTNTEFTADAKWLAERHSQFVRLRDFADLKRWLEEQFDSDSEWREIPNQIEVAPGVWISIPRPQILKADEIWQMSRVNDDVDA